MAAMVALGKHSNVLFVFKVMISHQEYILRFLRTSNAAFVSYTMMGIFQCLAPIIQHIKPIWGICQYNIYDH